MRGAHASIIAAVVLTGVWLDAAATNIAPDAITRATQGYNQFSGTLACLTDGATPDNSDSAEVFAWSSKGNLVFLFDTARAVHSVRLRVGADAGSYAVIAYLGAHYGSAGQTEVPEGAFVADVYDFDFAADGWVELILPPDTVTDYIEVITESGAQFYEIEILSAASVPTQVMSLSWGQFKHRSPRSAVRP